MSKALSFKNTVTFTFFSVFFYRFAIKLPTFPFHIWAARGSCRSTQLQDQFCYAGILLKMGAFGLLRIKLAYLYGKLLFFFTLVITLCFNFSYIYVCYSVTTG
jgi:NADH:ubiquinone oxidoreductase subunit 4 (subunit M)